VTASIAVIALLLAYISPSELIFTLVGYVWAGIGGTFSVVILLSLFWGKYHGRAVIATIISGLFFTIIWISTGMEEVVTSRILTFFVAGLTAVVFTFLLPVKEKT
jgi:sodium/proline symporter